ncbi:unnamed protein product [Diatraea saccharalis]|uniref:B-block binding subunit of TFIIIC domain-containing protein n=1 Tax=Diatraea saccharalis TaxID=40085 RepID=A0A9P0G141_9NEOP|nr:unnamed protein product [Diatraea saccharalis]
MSFKDVISKYNGTLVLVASKEERWAALAPHLPFSYIAQFKKIHYCLLELIGRSRENGQMTVGKSNVAKILKDSKLLFYNRKILQDLDLVRVSHITQVMANRGASKAILLRLRRFHQSSILSVPKIGWIHNLIEYLKERPNYCESTETVVSKGLMTQQQNKRFQKKFYIFGFEEQPVKLNELATSKKRERPNKKRRYIYLSSISDDEHSESEDEEHKSPMKCQYKVGVNLLRQAYERFLEAGLEGLTQIELGELLGIEFYVSRTICRLFKAKNIVREFLEDKGRQRLARFIAVAATAKMDIQYSKEKEKFLKYVDECINPNDNKESNKSSSDSEDSEVPRKKIKIENESEKHTEYEAEITEIKTIPGVPMNLPNPLSESSKKLTLRQLKFASGVLKVIRDRQIVFNYQELGRLIAAETKQPPMDGKALKTFLQRLVIDGCIKIYTIKWPGYNDKFTNVICAPHIKPSHPKIRTKGMVIVKNSTRNIQQAKKNATISRSLTEYSFPRYMKLQKLHMAMIKYAYFEDIKSEPNGLPQGFVYIKDLIPELTLEIALGTICSAGILNISRFNINDELLQTKLRYVPEELYKALTNTSHLDKSIRTNLKVLAMFGLVQLIAQVAPMNVIIPDNCLAIHLFYVNKNATILDTSGDWPKRNVNIQNFEKQFHFETFDRVTEFWDAVYSISTATVIDIPNRKRGKPPPVSIRTQNEVDEYDIGLRFGDNLGPCGFDSNFYLDVQRLWRAYCARSNHIPPNKQKRQSVIKIPKFEKPKRKVQRIVKKAIQKPKLIEKLPHIKKLQYKQALLRQPLPSRKKVSEQIIWTPEEDMIIMLCKTAITIMSPISQPGCLQVRNLVTKDILSIRDPKKSQKACHKRASIVDANSTMIHLNDCIMVELKRHVGITQKYDSMLKKLRILNSNCNNTKYLLAARVPMMELIWVLMTVLKACSVKQTVPVFPNLDELYKKFTVVPSSANRPGNKYQSAPDDFVIGPLKESIILTVMLSFENVMPKENAKKIYHNFKRYDERTLRKAVIQLRQSRAISAKEKILNGLLHKVNLDDIVDCWYKISAQYQRKWLIRLNSEFVDELANCFYKSTVEDDLKGSPELNCFCSELQIMGVLQITMTVAPAISGFSGSIIQEDQLNAIDIESRYKLKSGTLAWKVRSDIKNFVDIYKNMEIEEPLQDILRESVMEQNEILGSNLENVYTEVEDKIIAHLKQKRENGSNLRELKDISGLNYESLNKTLTKLITQKIIKRVGVYDNIIIMMEYIKKWSMAINKYYILSKPWLTIDAEIRKDIFLKWAGVVMNKVFENPGSSLSYLADNCEFLSTAAVQDVSYVLFKWKCVTLHTMIEKEPDLLSEDDDVIPELGEYNSFESPHNIIVLPVVDSFVRYSFIRKTILNSLN